MAARVRDRALLADVDAALDALDAVAEKVEQWVRQILPSSVVTQAGGLPAHRFTR